MISSALYTLSTARVKNAFPVARGADVSVTEETPRQCVGVHWIWLPFTLSSKRCKKYAICSFSQAMKHCRKQRRRLFQWWICFMRYGGKATGLKTILLSYLDVSWTQVWPAEGTGENRLRDLRWVRHTHTACALLTPTEHVINGESACSWMSFWSQWSAETRSPTYFCFYVLLASRKKKVSWDVPLQGWYGHIFCCVKLITSEATKKRILYSTLKQKWITG